MPDPAVELLKTLVAIDSVNPSLVTGASGEAAIARALAEHMRGSGWRCEVQEVAPGRPNVVGMLDGRAPGRSLMLCGHVDTVGVAGMARPFDPAERDGRVYGRGSQDMKSGVAAMIGAARLLAESGGLDAGQLIVACVVDEEHASIGADALVTRWRADARVVTEPTDLAIAVAHKGFEWVEIETEGRAAHGSRPRDGRDAILRMGRVLAELEALDRAICSRGRAHAAAGRRLAARVAHPRRTRAEQLSGPLSPADRATHHPRRSARAARGAKWRRSFAAAERRCRSSRAASRAMFVAFAPTRSRRRIRCRARCALQPDSNWRRRSGCHRHELLDRRGGAGRRRHPVGPLRARPAPAFTVGGMGGRGQSC